MATTKPARSNRVESVAQVLILLVIGGTAAAASFTHVHNVAVAHGQPGWLAWADAVVLELMSIATGLEIRRRHRTGQPAGFVLAILATAVALSLSAQVVEAERSIVGWLAAALPALGFLASVKIVLARTPSTVQEPLPHNDTTASAVSAISDVTPAQGQSLDIELANVEPVTVRRAALVPGTPEAFQRVNGVMPR